MLEIPEHVIPHVNCCVEGGRRGEAGRGRGGGRGYMMRSNLLCKKELAFMVTIHADPPFYYASLSQLYDRPIAWVVTSEIFPLNVRGRKIFVCTFPVNWNISTAPIPTGIAVSLTTAANWTGNFVLAITTPVLLASQLQTYGTFYIYSLLLAAAFLFVLLTLPETKVGPHPP